MTAIDEIRIHTEILLKAATEIAKLSGTRNIFLDVVEFHKRYGIEYEGPVRTLPPNLNAFRDKRLREEFDEHWAAKTQEEKFDSLIDLIYIALGTIHLHGWNFNEGWRRVHDANMKKQRHSAQNPSKYGIMYDVVKPPGWARPDLKDLVIHEP